MSEWCARRERDSNTTLRLPFAQQLHKAIKNDKVSAKELSEVIDGTITC